MPQHYPFSAVLGCETDALDDMGLALVLTTISPEIGGVLVRGEKGTAKSTTVRALAAVLPPIEVYAADRFSVDPADPAATSPDGPFGTGADTAVRSVRLVELPVGATEDRVLGSLHLERALSHGKVEYEPGLLARAHRGILYVDEVNLLHDHLVDLLLDAAAMGQVTVERDGVSVEHAARFVLIGTMNPEEGELRPQLLDRFGLTVEVAAPREPALRAEVVRRRMAYDADPVAFAARYRDADRALTERVESARERLAKVRLTESALMKIAEVCATFEVDGLRADIVTARTAVAHAAWEGRDEVTRADIRRAALLALPHRRRRNPFDAPGLDEDLLDQVLGDDELPPEPPEGPAPDEPQGPPEDDTPDQAQADGPRDEAGEGDSDQASTDDTLAETPAESDGEQPMTPPAGTEAGSTVRATAPYRPRLLKVQGLGEGAAGRRSRALASTGRRVGARLPDGPTGSLHLVETLLAAAGKQSSRGRTTGRVELRNEDLRVAVREGREANLVLFCVDASGSMAARKRMSQVKTAILSLLLDAYRRRDKVGLVTFRGAEATVALPPTRSVDIAAARLDEVPAGGRTPLAEGLLEAARVLTRERMRDPRLRPLLVLVTDGRATGGKDAVARSQQAAEYVAGLGVTTVVIDGESGPLRLGLALRLAELLRAEHLPVAEVSAEALAGTVRSRTQKGAA
ncbi:VWA domain-containing protein [Nocardioides sp. TRM66260-LWL]|uniref:VWA domain-containing protein n=1 Tax=Nocardioides sp. TRM66260-LWL TaxID=2874478 RepID=UPI001CC71BA3|nr:VWA domain-containing protein [Nocardioides sp. TRM66260-LWL]MBZ5736423.1 VWA domain-containing protein [Nocardioides sp. TRM66260-LWL]